MIDLKWVAVCVFAMTVLGCSSASLNPRDQADMMMEDDMQSVHDFTVDTIDGESVSLSKYKGRVMLIVNVASKCGFTGQYEGLQALYETYKDREFEILGFPANNFLWQEPGSNEAIKQFCTTNYGVTFPMFAKISVKGVDQNPVYSFLTDKTINPEYGGKITWNFNKFLIDGDGKVVNRFDTKVDPLDKQIVSAIEAALAEQ